MVHHNVHGLHVSVNDVVLKDYGFMVERVTVGYSSQEGESVEELPRVDLLIDGIEALSGGRDQRSERSKINPLT